MEECSAIPVESRQPLFTGNRIEQLICNHQQLEMGLRVATVALPEVHPVTEVFPEDAEELLAQGWHLFDCRSAEEYEAEHIPGARHIPLDALADRLSEIDSGKRYVVYCRSGVRSLRASSLLLCRGVEAVSMKGGIQAWCGELSTDENEKNSPEYSNGNCLPYQPGHHQESLTGRFMN